MCCHNGNQRPSARADFAHADLADAVSSTTLTSLPGRDDARHNRQSSETGLNRVQRTTVWPTRPPDERRSDNGQLQRLMGLVMPRDEHGGRSEQPSNSCGADLR